MLCHVKQLVRARQVAMAPQEVFEVCPPGTWWRWYHTTHAEWLYDTCRPTVNPVMWLHMLSQSRHPVAVMLHMLTWYLNTPNTCYSNKTVSKTLPVFNHSFAELICMTPESRFPIYDVILNSPGCTSCRKFKLHYYDDLLWIDLWLGLQIQTRQFSCLLILIW